MHVRCATTKARWGLRRQLQQIRHVVPRLRRGRRPSLTELQQNMAVTAYLLIAMGLLTGGVLQLYGFGEEGGASGCKCGRGVLRI